MKKSACPAVGKKCTRCGKEGHFANKCDSRSGNHVQDCEIYSHKPSSISVYVTVRLNNNAKVQLQIDTGASCNILPINVTTSGLKETNSVRIWNSRMQGLSCATRL